MAGPSTLELARRAGMLGVLILRAGALYARGALSNRGILRLGPGEFERRFAAFARRFVVVATRFRGGLIKLGQVASLRVDVVPEAVTDELAKLQDQVPPHPFAEVELQIRRELGPIAEHFGAFDREAIASASLGQVHRARSKAGADLAVKVLYPGIEKSVAVDLTMARIALVMFDFVTPADLKQVYRELRASLLGEMDYLREGRAAEEIAANLERDPALSPNLRIPKIHWETTSRRVLSMEYIEGTKINDRERLEERGVDLEEVVRWASGAFLQMMFEDGFFHCDPHPGNLLVDLQGRVAILDFGMNKRIEPEVMVAIRKNVMASVKRDARLYASSLLEAGVIAPTDIATVEQIAEISFDPEYFNLTPQEVANLDFGEYFKRMRVHLKKIESFHLPDGLVMWSRAISLLYGLSSELAPGLRPLDIVGPYLMRFLQGGAADLNRGAAQGV